MLPPPYRTKVVEPISLVSPEMRQKRMQEAHFNLFKLDAKDVFIDLLTDSGTSAMSDQQWGGMMVGDESYAGGRSFYHLQSVVTELTGHEVVIPTHQGRAAENVLFSSLLLSEEVEAEKSVILNNTHFDTTRANIEQLGATALDLPCLEVEEVEEPHPFKGNMNIAALQEALKKFKGRVPLVMMTLTNNACGGQPASLENIRAVGELCYQHKIPFFLDACRFAENACFIQQRESGQKGRCIKEIVRDIFSVADGCTFSGKKDALVNIGGFVTLREKSEWLHSICNRLILHEGFCTYGGLAGRDLEAMAVGMKEVMEETYLHFRTQQVALLGDILIKAGIRIVQPAGGHAIYVDAAHFLPHLSKKEFPGQALTIALYKEFGVRAVEIGSVMFPDVAKMELVRLAIPRRVYSNDHLRYVGHALCSLFEKRKAIRGVCITQAPSFLRHFTAQFEELA